MGKWLLVVGLLVIVVLLIIGCIGPPLPEDREDIYRIVFSSPAAKSAIWHTEDVFDIKIDNIEDLKYDSVAIKVEYYDDHVYKVVEYYANENNPPFCGNYSIYDVEQCKYIPNLKVGDEIKGELVAGILTKFNYIPPKMWIFQNYYYTTPERSKGVGFVFVADASSSNVQLLGSYVQGITIRGD